MNGDTPVPLVSSVVSQHASACVLRLCPFPTIQESSANAVGVIISTDGRAAGEEFTSKYPEGRRSWRGCLAPHRLLRGAILPTPRQQDVDRGDARTESPRWSWARWRKRVFDLDMALCPLCRRGSLRIIVAITQKALIPRILRPVQRVAVPPPRAPARARQAALDWVA
jgi:hypothetical protein